MTRTKLPALPAGGCLALAGVLLVAVNLRAATAGVGTALPSIVSDLGISSSLASGLVVAPLLCFAVVSPFAPGFIRRFGLRGATITSLALLAVGVLMRSVPGAFWLWVGTILLGSSIAVLNVVAPALVKRDFPHRVSAMTSLYSGLQSGAAALATAAVSLVLATDSMAWRLALGITAGLALVGAVFWLLRRTEAPTERVTDVIVTNAVRQPGVWRRARAWQIVMFMSMQSAVYYVLVTWLPSIEVEAGVSLVAAGLHQTALQAAGLVATLASGWLLSRGEDQRPIAIASTFLMAIGVAGILIAPSFALLWAIVVGAASGATLVTALSLFGLRTHTVAQTSAIAAMAQSMGYLIAALCPPLLGLLHDSSGSWDSVLIALLGLLCVQLAGAILAARPGQIWDDILTDNNPS